jgi:Xaa-Pro aminopeptidase
LSKDYFLENEMITCEPGLYIPEKFGIRIEDLGIVTEKGFKTLIEIPKELTVIK